MAGQMVSVLALSLLALFSALMVLELAQHESAAQTAQHDSTLERLTRLYSALERINEDALPEFLNIASSCHAGHTVTQTPFRTERSDRTTSELEGRVARSLSLDLQEVQAGYAHLSRDDFAYSKCLDSEIALPFEGIVISVRLPSGKWFNAEVHPHEWHFREKLDWMLQASAAFLFLGAVSMFFMHRLSTPLSNLTRAAREFGAGLRPAALREEGPLDVRRALQAFNSMQRQVSDEVTKRMNTLAAISHDIRTPLTALRVKAELIDDASMRADIVSSIDRIERITATALEYLRGRSSGEPFRLVDLSALVESECVDFEELGHDVQFLGEHGIEHSCRADALASAVRNLIENAVRYGRGARVSTSCTGDGVCIAVRDSGPGIPSDELARVVEPFVRRSPARESDGGGFGLGLALVKAIAESHGGQLELGANDPTGLVATIRLPCTQGACRSP